jgi:hypothetical protein
MTVGRALRVMLGSDDDECAFDGGAVVGAEVDDGAGEGERIAGRGRVVLF